MQGGIGARVNMGEVTEPHVTLFSETQARALVSVTPENLEAFKMMASDLGVPVREIGLVGGGSVRVAGAFELNLAQIKEVYDTALEKMIAGAHH
jgi:phosphoribosylformylglycinamidine synthase